MVADDDLQFDYIAYTSLDVVDERISAGVKNSGDLRELYLGLLYPTEDYKVYPYIFYAVTNTSVANIDDQI